jgi:hypothetical protein
MHTREREISAAESGGAKRMPQEFKEGKLRDA